MVHETNGAKASWKMLSCMAACIVTTVILMWGVSTAFDELQDKDSAIESDLATLKSSALSPEDLVDWEHRMTSVEKTIEFLQKDSHPKGNEK